MYSRTYIPCLYCGHPADQEDHIHPRCDGGGDQRSNLAPACKSCNSAKGGRPVEFFLREHPVVLARVRAYQAGQDVLSTLTPGEKPRAADDRINTTVRISPEGLEALKNVAAAKRVRVNDLLLDGAEHVLALYGRKMQLRGV
jgi:hypothetical protein